MNYEESLQVCIDDLMSRPTKELLIAAGYYDVKEIEKRELCRTLAQRFLSPYFTIAKMSPDAPKYVRDFVEKYQDILIKPAMNLMREKDKELNVAERRNEETIERHALIGISSLMDFDVLKWALEKESEQNKYTGIWIDRGKLQVTNNLLSYLHITEENVDWLLLYLIEHNAALPDYYIDVTDSPVVIRKILEKFPDLPFSIDWLTEAIDIVNPNEAVEKVRVIMNQYGELSSEDLDIVTRSYRHFKVKANPTVIALAAELGIELNPVYRTKGDAMNAMARGEISRQDGIALMKDLPATLATEEERREECEPPEEFKDCSNEKDYITQECWSKEAPAEIKIKFLDPDDYSRTPNVLCMTLESFKGAVEEPANEFRAWYQNDVRQVSGKEIDSEGYGGKPSTVEVYTRLPVSNYVSNFVDDMKGLVGGDYVAYPLFTKKRIGNPAGTFGVSETHGGAPGETIYYITPPGDAREIVLAEIERINKLKGLETEVSEDTPVKDLIEEVLDKNTIPIVDRVDDVSEELLAAAARGETERVQELLSDGANVDYQDEEGLTVLMYAIENNKLDTVNVLIDAGADLNMLDEAHGWPALRYALRNENENIDIVNVLVEAGADLNIQDKEWKISDLMIAAGNGMVDIVRALLAAGADVSLKSEEGKTAIDYATSQEIRDLLRVAEAAAEVNKELIRAAGRGDPKRVEDLIRDGADVDYQDKNGWTALMYAIRNHKIDTVNTLISAGANVNVKNKSGDSALIIAVDNEYIDIVKELLNARADTTIKTKIGGLPLTELTNNQEILNMLQAAAEEEEEEPQELLNLNDELLLVAAAGGDHERVQDLLSDGANVNYQNEDGWTALMFAADAINGNADIVRALLDAGADINIRSRMGERARNLTYTQENQEIRYMLQAADEEAEAEDEEEVPVENVLNLNEELLLAATRGDHRRVQDLLSDGADVNFQDNNGYTALMLATINGKVDTVRTLLDSGADATVETVIGDTLMDLTYNQEIINLLQAAEEEEEEQEEMLEEAFVNFFARQDRCTLLFMRKSNTDEWTYAHIYCNPNELETDWAVYMRVGDFQERLLTNPISESDPNRFTAPGSFSPDLTNLIKGIPQAMEEIRNAL